MPLTKDFKETVRARFDDKVLALYARGLTTRELQQARSRRASSIEDRKH